jgi:class 3 adenylate cyclase
MAIFGLMRILSIFFFAFLFLGSEKSHAQEGLPFLTEVTIDSQFSNARIGSIVQDGEETMFFSTSRGVMKFDGSTWELIATPSPASEVYYHEASNRIFVGLKNGAAEILQTDSGTYQIQSIPGISSGKAVTRIISNGPEVHFIGEAFFYTINPLEKKDARLFEFTDRMINGVFVFRQNLFLIFYQEGLFTWSNEELVSVGPHERVTDDQMLFSFQTEAGTYIGFDNDILYLFNGNSFKPVRTQLERFLNENLLSGGLLLNDSLMALSTLAGGAVIVNIENQNIRHRFDYTTGVNDNEIFCLGKDGDEGLWLAFESGLSRVDLNQPVKSFSGFPGLEGNLTTSLLANGSLYVGTGSGVFVLQKATSAAEIKRMMENLAKRNLQAKQRQSNAYTPKKSSNTDGKNRKAHTLLDQYKSNPEEVKKELSKKELRELKRELRKQRKEDRKNKPAGQVISDFFNGGKDEAERVENESKPNQALVPDPKTGSAGSGMTTPPGSGVSGRSQPQVLNNAKNKKRAEADQQRISAMQNTFLFKKIKGLDVKCRQLIEIEGQVFAATNNGLYIIEESQSRNLTPGLYINHATTTNDKKLLLATLTGVYELSKSETGIWESVALNDSIQFVAYNAAQGDDGSIWAGTDNGAFRYSLNETKYYSLPDVANEQVLVSNVYGKMHFLLPSALFHHISKSDTILPAVLPDVPSSGQLNYVLGNNGVIWIKSAAGWRVLNGDEFVPMLPYMDLFEDIRHISTDSEGNIYVIDEGDNVYSILNKKDDSELKFNLYIRQVADANGNTFSLEKMNVESERSALVFNVSAPFYLKSQGTRYQYRIEGPMSKWSKWSSESQIKPGMLSPGDYVLEARAKNILGEVSETKTLAFTVDQRLWLRWYALLAYTLLLSLGIFGLVKYRERSLKETQKELEEKVAQRTADLEKSKEQAEALLLNILPKETAEELKLHGQATAKHYNQVSVLFTDFKGFTEFAENTKPQDLVNELHRCFVKFDEIIGKYNLEKIKTIGDAYMCAGGVPIRNNSNAIASTLAALEIRNYMDEVVAQKRQNDEQVLEIRVGIHTGPLTAGVVGVKKFAYDIWGDTVNTASRMETASVPGKVNVSGTTYELIKKYFECESRGKKAVKGKGAVEMYFVNAIKPEFSENSEGIEPNKGLWEIID